MFQKRDRWKMNRSSTYSGGTRLGLPSVWKNIRIKNFYPQRTRRNLKPTLLNVVSKVPRSFSFQKLNTFKVVSEFWGSIELVSSSNVLFHWQRSLTTLYKLKRTQNVLKMEILDVQAVPKVNDTFLTHRKVRSMARVLLHTKNWITAVKELSLHLFLTNECKKLWKRDKRL